ncbi:hypothetical protein COU89_03700 [Candidatus Roizmanbacteria bacterium CG10_big_fil_rev_8_21_14_0_10_45_7]|uniref:Uncharacterized protein n=1 Tax=Candidatus Roizmanbacteria bacterium CG10_big_fil_rev_8_21_14_0_10_45_7 TaxID=1974854 RepID=A0A2M8KTV7_9BACT|nr:MAG: hypothetical protein COU89_03700 [Candidatus Roizmanbacteria bacterium CG10_big_fil_rev_8_21_14_0_10_45_7]
MKNEFDRALAQARNIQRLADYTSALRGQYQFPIFSGHDVLYNGRMDTLPESKLPYVERRTRMLAFWKTIVTCGSITDIFMMPGWERSEGARDEHNSALQMGITLHYKDFLLNKSNNDKLLDDEVWHYKIVWVGPELEASPCWREGGYPIWGQFEVIMDHNTVDREHE